MIKKPILSLISLSSVYSTTSKPTSNYVSRGLFSFSDADMNQGAIIGDDPSTIAFTDAAQGFIRMTKISEDGVIAIGQTLESDDSTSSSFGSKLDLYVHPKEGNHLLVSDANLAYFYAGGDWNTWSVQQVLKPPTGYSTADTYGLNVRVDRTDFRKAVVSCEQCGTSPFPPGYPTGQIFVYESDPRHNSWSQTSILESLQAADPGACSGPGPFGDYSIFLGQADVRVSDKNILASTAYTRCATGGAILFSKRGNQWSQQQTFYDRNTEYNSLAIERDTIIIGARGASYGTTADVGAVYIQYPNTPEYGVKPEPGVPQQWSLHQILYPPVTTGPSLFGSDLTILDNRLFIGSDPLNTIFYYKREKLNGYWSLQQSLTTSELEGLAAHQVFGSTVLGLGRKTGVGAVSTIFENNYEWNCLIVSLEDQFGDGWDTAKLQITTPTGETSYVSPFCTSSNPFEFRYCPRYGTSDYEGMYRFSILDGPKAKFFWEIQWRVYEEKSGQWYRGNHATRMDFHFDADELEFSRRGIVHDLPLNISCVSCPGKPQEKSEKPKPRALKDNTLAPTISPAPTLGQTIIYDDSWRYLTLTTTGEPWFDNQHQGTNYYISDSQGHRLLATGTSCSTLSSSCYQTLPDGQYVLRVGGGLNNYHDDHKWSFCGRVGGAEEQLNFIIKNGECDAVTSYTRPVYCSAVLQATIVVSVQLEMFGISETTSIEELKSADLLALSDSIAGIIGHSVSASDIKLNAITNQFGHAIFDVTIRVDANQFGGNPQDLDSMETVVTNVGSIFNNAASTGRLNTALKSTTIQNAQFFQRIDGVQVIDTKLVSIQPHADTLVNDMVTNVVQEPTVTVDESNQYSQSFYLMVAGYMAAVVAVVALAVYAYTQVKSPKTQATVSQNIESTKMDVSSNIDSSTTVVNPVVSTAAAPASTSSKSLKSVDSTKKSQRMNTIMIADLIQMVKEEDEQLQKTMASDHFNV